MLKLNSTSRKLEAVSSTTLTQAKILERAVLQDAILRSWDSFCGELGFEELFLVGSEIVPHESCNVRIDILALGGDGKPVVFELKRHHERLQLLQALSYAAMLPVGMRNASSRNLARVMMKKPMNCAHY